MGVAFRELPVGRSRWRLPQSRDRELQGSTHCGYCVRGTHLLPIDHDRWTLTGPRSGSVEPDVGGGSCASADGPQRYASMGLFDGFFDTEVRRVNHVIAKVGCRVFDALTNGEAMNVALDARRGILQVVVDQPRWATD
jgi:hypothetical protein